MFAIALGAVLALGIAFALMPHAAVPSRVPPALNSLPRPMIWAHRGGADEGPEGTLPTMLAAIRRDPKVGIELDVRATRDGHIVVLHDSTVDRTTDGRGPVAELDLAAVTALDAAHCSLARIDGSATTNPAVAGANRVLGDTADRAAKTTHGDLADLPLVPGRTARREICRDPAQAHRFGLRGRGFRIPTLEEVLQTLPPSTLVAIEVKAPGFEEALARLLRDSGRAGRLVVGSGNDEAAERLHSLVPPAVAAHYFPRWAAMRLAAGTRLAAGRVSWPDYQIFASPKQAAGMSLATPGFITDLHRQGLWAVYFVIDDETEMETLFRAGADAIITDLPGLAARVRDRVRPTETRSRR